MVLDSFRARLGGTPEELLQWVVDFAQRNLTTAGPGEQRDIGDALRALPALVIRGYGNVWRPKKTAMAPDALLTMQGKVGTALRDVVEGSGWILEGRILVSVASDAKTDRRRVEVLTYPAMHEDDGIMASVVDLIIRLGEHLRVCPARNCGRIFVGQGKQRFCSTQHAQRERNDKYYRKRRAKEQGRDKDKVKINHHRRR